MITKFDSLYAGHVDMENVGYAGTAVNDRSLPDKELATAFDKAEANSEMEFYGFPSADQSYLIQSLESIGAMVYRFQRDGEDLYYWLRVPLTEGVVKIRRLPRN